MKRLLPLILLLAAAPAAHADTSAAPADTTRGASRVYLPVLAYSPDTDLMFGGTVLQFFYLEEDGPGVRPSTVSPVLIRTSRSQTLAFLNADANWDRGRQRLFGGVSFIRFPDKYYGLGRDSHDDAEEDYTPEAVGLELGYERQIVGSLRAGAAWQRMESRIRERVGGGLLVADGHDAHGTLLTSRPQLSLAWDTRDHTWAPRRGLWVKALYQPARSWSGSDLHFTGHVIDLRAYAPAGGGGTWAVQLAATWMTGEAPLFALPRLGGQSGLRGYPGSRYLDAAAAFGRVEWRSGPFWGRLGAAAFAGLGDVAPRLGDLTTGGGLWTAGWGLRFALNREERVNLRLDWGAGEGETGFTITLGEAF